MDERMSARVRARLSLRSAHFAVGRVGPKIADGDSALLVHHRDQTRQ